jgi:hypothetical protein
MKIMIKYLWSLVLVPFLLFVKGDLSIDTLASITHIDEPIKSAQLKVSSAVAKEGDITFSIPIKVIASNKSFSGNGLKVKLFDEEYTQIAESQILNGLVKFTIPISKGNIKNFHVVSVETSEEVVVECLQKIEVSLEINEAHLKQ